MADQSHGSYKSTLSGNRSQSRPSRTDSVPFAQRVTCTIPEGCQVTGLGRTKLYELIGGGYLSTISIGRRRLVHVTSLLKLVNSDRNPQTQEAPRAELLFSSLEVAGRDVGTEKRKLIRYGLQ